MTDSPIERVARASANRLDSYILAEHWFSFIQSLLGDLQHAFRASGLTQKTIAKRLGKKPEVISLCLSGQKNMTIRTMHDLARAMDCRLEITIHPLKDQADATRA